MKRKHEWIRFNYRYNNQMKMETGRPVDLTFQKIEELNDVSPELAREGRVGKAELSSNMKFLTRSVWLNHNRIKNLNNIYALVDSVIDHPENLGFLDLSFNSLEKLGDNLSEFPNLVILYLHGNNLNDVVDLTNLNKLKKLRSLTIYGNPILDNLSLEKTRSLFYTIIPNLKNLDYKVRSKTELVVPLNRSMMKLVETSLPQKKTVCDKATERLRKKNDARQLETDQKKKAK